MSGLLLDWTLYMQDAEIPDDFFLYQNMVIQLPAFNALSVQGFFQAPANTSQCGDSHVGGFAGEG
ncbi:hypothetical protein DSO57_1030247 [Entomophthora muscae]|uniref:Uncharacterized protein n=1 Tax=Entomophthora muscae TaxID=34485 RepID=A0ACC2TC28_9FUNG|nr:hypothetical protein DSO57_1030247 [Entomophthora muscae]